MKNSKPIEHKPQRTIVEFVRYFSLFVSKILWRIEFINTENIPVGLEKGFLITPNHQTYFDPFWVCIPIKKDMRYMAWDKAFGMYFFGWLLRLVGAFPVSLTRGGTPKALRDSLKYLREGKALLIFPEGEREYSDGKMLNFKTGAVKLAIAADVPILPVTVRGGNRIWSRDHKFPLPGKIQIYYHPVIHTSNSEQPKDLQEINDELKQIIASKL